MSDPRQEKNTASKSGAQPEKRPAPSDTDQNIHADKNINSKNFDPEYSAKARFAAPFIPAGVVAALLIASLIGYEVPVYSANIAEPSLTSGTDTADTADSSTVTLPELTEQPDEERAAASDSIESIAYTDESDVKYTDGTYTGTGTGWGGTIKVQVVIRNGRISSVTILSAPDETPEYFTKAKSITSAIVEAQSTNVDTVSGATYSSNGIIEAVRDALAKASGSSSSSLSSSAKKSSSKKASGKATAKTLASADESSAQYADGTWTGTGEGWGGDITVKVRIKNGEIKKITVADASDETEEYFNKATAVIDSIISSQSTNVDTVSGATYSSNGIIEAVRDALSKAAAAAGNTSGADSDGSSADSGTGTSSGTSSALAAANDGSDSPYADGTWTGTGEGWGGDITVAVTIESGVITAIEITSAENETAAYLKKAEAVIESMLSAQSAVVDTVSGATYSSQGIIDAVQAALEKAAAAKSASGTGESEDGSSSSAGTSDDPDSSDSDSSDPDSSDPDSSGSGSSGSDSSDSDSSDPDSSDSDSSDSDSSDSDSSDSDSSDSDSSDADSSGTTENSGDDANDSSGTTNGDSDTDPDDSDISSGDDADDGCTMQDGSYSIETTVYSDTSASFSDYPISMLVTIENDAITSVDDITGDTNAINLIYLDLAANGNSKYTGVVAQITAAGNADNIDVVSGATCSSNAIIAGAKLAIEEATAAKASD